MPLNWERLGFGKQPEKRIANVLENIEQLFGNELVVSYFEGNTVYFYVSNLTDEVLIRRLEAAQDQVFGHDLAYFQVLLGLGTQPGRGLILRYFPNKAGQKAGFWYY